MKLILVYGLAKYCRWYYH